VIRKSGNQRALAALLLALSLHPALSWASETGSICIAPLPKPIPIGGGISIAGDPSMGCASGKYSFKIDTQKPVPWPRSESIKIEDLSLNGRHRGIVECDNKPLQSFSFRFSDYKMNELCLFLNDLYWTIQLWTQNGHHGVSVNKQYRDSSPSRLKCSE
jgi:hypothetical protein